MQNGQNRSNRGRHKRMYELTGIPGWIRYSYSPGFAGGGIGRGPCADYIKKTDQMDAYLKDLAEKNPDYGIWANAMENLSKNNPDFQKEQLTHRIRGLEEEIKFLKKELKEFR